MKVYLAHNFEARVWLKDYIQLLNLCGHECTSRWITAEDTCGSGEEARDDLADIDKANAIVLFTDQYGTTPGKGKFLELGYALARGKICILYGRDLTSCVFYKLKEIKTAKDFECVLYHLRKEEVDVKKEREDFLTMLEEGLPDKNVGKHQPFEYDPTEGK